MNFEKEVKNPINNIKEKIDNESSVVKNILAGKFNVEFISESLNSDEFKDSGHLANRYAYELTVPSPTNNQEDWNTKIYIYHPNRKNDRFERVPDFSIKILTGQGEMELTPDIKIKEIIFKKIAEQIYIKNNVENEYIPSRHFSFDGFLEMIEFLESNPDADKIPTTLWISRKKEIIIDKNYWLLMSETLRNFQKTIYSKEGEKEFNDLLNRVKEVNPSFNFTI